MRWLLPLLLLPLLYGADRQARCALEPWVVTVELPDPENPKQRTFSQGGDTTFVTATVTHCGGQIAPNALMTWTARTEAVATVEQSTQLVATITAVGAGTTYIVGESDGGGADSVSITVNVCVPTATHICAGDNVATKVAAQAAGTSFTFGSGTFANASVTPKANMTFTGAANHATIFDGGKTLTGWTASGGDWFVGQQIQQGTVSASVTCQSVANGDPENWPRCNVPEQLWMDSTLKRHVATRDSVKAGTWFFDYTADVIWVGDDPNGRLVETSVTANAFNSAVTGVTIQGFTIRHYASDANTGTIEARGTNWTIDDNVVVDNNMVCIRVENDGQTVSDNLVKRCGQYGLSAGDPTQGELTGLNFLRNRADSNCINRIRRGFGCGGSKFTRTNGMNLIGNRADRNLGNAWWADIDNQNWVVTSDTAQFNDGHGIFYEISYGCTITNNVSISNGQLPTDVNQNGAGIIISASDDCEVSGNTVTDNAHGIILFQQARGSGILGEYLVENVSVHDNVITQDEGSIGWIGDATVAFHTGRGNSYECNDYTLTGATEYFQFEGATKTDNEWQAAGHDNGACTTITRN